MLIQDTVVTEKRMVNSGRLWEVGLRTSHKLVPWFHFLKLIPFLLPVLRQRITWEKKKHSEGAVPTKEKIQTRRFNFLKLKKHRQNNNIRNQESGYLWGRGEKLVSSINILGISIRNYFISLECYMISRYVRPSNSPKIHDHYSLSLPHKIIFSTMQETMSREQSSLLVN